MPGASHHWKGLRRAAAETLKETLRSWLPDHGRRGAVAAELFAHPQTLGDRMRQLREVSGDVLRTRTGCCC